MDFESVDEGFIAKLLVPSGTKEVKIQTVSLYFLNQANRYISRRKGGC